MTGHFLFRQSLGHIVAYFASLCQYLIFDLSGFSG